MWSFRNNRLLEPVDVTVANLMAALGRYQGRQELYRRQAPQVLETLRRIAIVESTEASNRIEGIVVPPHRFKALMAQAVPETSSGRCFPFDKLTATSPATSTRGGTRGGRAGPMGVRWCVLSPCRPVRLPPRWMNCATPWRRPGRASR